MQYGEQSFLEGLQAVANTVLKDAAGIAELRIKSATMKANADIGLLNARFQASLSDPDVDPMTFESRFADHQSAIKDYVDTVQFAPAREAVLAQAESTLPQLYLNGAQEMNKANLRKSLDEYNATGLVLQSDTASPPEQWRANLQQHIDSGVRNGWMSKEQAVKAGLSFDSAYRVRKLSSSLDGLGGLAERQQFLANAEAVKAVAPGATPDEVHSLMTQVSAQLSASDTATIASVKQSIGKDPNAFMTQVQLDEALVKTNNISASAKAQIASLYQKQNADALDSSYRQQINNTGDLKGLEGILENLRTEGDSVKLRNPDGTVISMEFWAGEEEKRRTELQKLVQSKIDDLKGPKGKPDERPSDVDDAESTLRKNLVMLGSLGVQTIRDPRTGQDITIKVSSDAEYREIVSTYAFARIKGSDGKYYNVFKDPEQFMSTLRAYEVKKSPALMQISRLAEDKTSTKRDAKGNYVVDPGKTYLPTQTSEAEYLTSEYAKANPKLGLTDLTKVFNSFLITPATVKSLNEITLATGISATDKRDQDKIDTVESWVQYMNTSLPLFNGNRVALADHLRAQGIESKDLSIESIMDEVDKKFLEKAKSDLGPNVVMSSDSSGRILYTTPVIFDHRGNTPAKNYFVRVFSGAEAKDYNSRHKDTPVTPGQEWWMLGVIDPANSKNNDWVPFRLVGVKTP